MHFIETDNHIEWSSNEPMNGRYLLVASVRFFVDSCSTSSVQFQATHYKQTMNVLFSGYKIIKLLINCLQIVT